MAHLADESCPRPIRCLWIIVAVTGLILTASSTYWSVSYALKGGTSSTEMSVQELTEGHFEYPKVHLCTSNIFNHDVLKSLGFVNDEMISYLLLATSVLAASPILLENDGLQAHLQDRFDSLLSSNNLTIQDVFRKAILRCDEIVAGCIAPGVFIDGARCCAEHFASASFLSPSGSCVTSHSSPPQYQVKTCLL